MSVCICLFGSTSESQSVGFRSGRGTKWAYAYKTYAEKVRGKGGIDSKAESVFVLYAVLLACPRASQ